mmetsp:Transcript_13027/g.22345  ORF Transcript_13027/g.22345 Transcript_13027/m.22345 type:complete len:107 (+) Transcript_13027:35-355(+)
MASSQLTTTSEVEVLQARIATLEKENRELIKQNQRLVRNHKISPQSLKLTSNGDERTSKRTSVYFDGYKTRVDGGEDLEQKNSTGNCFPPHKTRHVENVFNFVHNQ